MNLFLLYVPNETEGRKEGKRGRESLKGPKLPFRDQAGGMRGEHESGQWRPVASAPTSHEPQQPYCWGGGFPST